MDRYTLCAEGRRAEAKPLAKAFPRYLHDVLIQPLVHEAGLWDSAIDRIQRVAGGGGVGPRGQSPHRSGSEKHVRQPLARVKKHTPELLPRGSGRGVTVW